MSLGPKGMFFSHLFSYHCTSAFSSHLIGYVIHLFFLILSTICLFHISLHPGGWSSSVHHMEGSHIISAIYLADTDLEILGLRRSSCQREFVCYLSIWGCVHLLSISSLGFICSCSGYAYLYICKKKKYIIIIISTCVYVHSVLDHWVCILMSGGHFYRVCSLLGVRMWALWDPMLFVLLRHIYLWERRVTFF